MSEPVWEISPALTAAQLAATVARADAGSGNARIRVYASARPASIAAAAADAPLVEIVLAKPCGTVTAGVLALTPLDADGALVLASGIPRWGDWVAADGVVLARGDVTDVAHGGCFQLAGAATPAGETAPLLIAGGRVQLGATALT